tara:strand:+ start:119 stop:292 length:174 start_codon:yes stop_codon:yes gene_type:complete
VAKLRFRTRTMSAHLKKMLAKHRRGEKIGATAMARLKARGLIKRKSGKKKRGRLGKR